VVDFLWPSKRLVIELDGHAFHSTRAAFERDRVRDAKLQLAGCRVMRVTYRRLDREPAVVAEDVGALLSAGPAA
jgi:very-short-patch-repair endonuclease